MTSAGWMETGLCSCRGAQSACLGTCRAQKHASVDSTAALRCMLSSCTYLCRGHIAQATTVMVWPMVTGQCLTAIERAVQSQFFWWQWNLSKRMRHSNCTGFASVCEGPEERWYWWVRLPAEVRVPRDRRRKSRSSVLHIYPKQSMDHSLHRWIAYRHMHLGLKVLRLSGGGVLLWNHGQFIF